MGNTTWIEYQLGELLSYEQPTPYIVESTKYNDTYPIPVLTPGKSFILGYTNECSGIYDKLPVIIFDDFTTASRHVTFPFKVKSSAMKILTANPEIVNSKFIYYRMQIIDFDCSTHKRYWIQSYSKIKVHIPPLEEQRRIVARIEELFSELDAAVATLERTKEQLAVYRQAVLKEAFEEISEFVTLQSISEKIFDGPFGSNLKTADYTTSGIRVVRLENLKNGWFDDSKQSFVTSDKYEKISSHTVYPTDLIMSTFISDAIKVCQLPEYIEYAVNKADCVGIRLKESVNQRYVMYYLLTQQAFSSLEHNVHGATRPRVNTTHIKEINVPICDRKKQNQIVSEVESRLSVCDKIEETVNTALQEAEAMRQSILKQAFSGEL